jgi:LacI family transcriptional regulator
LLVLDVRNPFFTDVARGVEDVIVADRRGVLLANSDEDPDREARYLDLFEEQRVDGILISPIGKVIERLGRIRSRGISVVLVDRLASTDNFASVAVDDVVGGQLAAEHLIAVGRRRLAFVGGPRSIEQVVNRLRGARVAARAAGVTLDDRYELSAMNSQAAGILGREIAALPPADRPDAVFAANDLIALGLLQAFAMAGLAVPGDIALIGYDDIAYASSAAIPLSSIRQPAREMGHRAAELLLEEIEGESDPGSREHVVFEPELIIRESTVRRN